jgi:hypothetical protein
MNPSLVLHSDDKIPIRMFLKGASQDEERNEMDSIFEA